MDATFARRWICGRSSKVFFRITAAFRNSFWTIGSFLKVAKRLHFLAGSLGVLMRGRILLTLYNFLLEPPAADSWHREIFGLTVCHMDRRELTSENWTLAEAEIKAVLPLDLSRDFSSSCTRVRRKEGTDDEANDKKRRADHCDLAGARNQCEVRRSLPQAPDVGRHVHTWKAKYFGTTVSEAKRLKALEHENVKLKRLIAEQMLDMAAMR